MGRLSETSRTFTATAGGTDPGPHLVAVTNAGGAAVDEVTRRTEYDPVYGRVSREIDAEGHVTRHEIDPDNGNCMPLKHIPTGLSVHNIELEPGKGGAMCRSAGMDLDTRLRQMNFCRQRSRWDQRSFR